MKKKITAIALSFFLIGSAVLANNMRVNLNGFHFIAPAVNGKTNVYNPAVGEIVYDSSDAKFWGYDQTGTWVNLTGGGTANVPVGTILPYAGNVSTIPAGYLLANGAILSRTSYSNLFSVIGTQYGAGDGSTTFALPDTRNVFLRGANANTRDINGITYPAVVLGTNYNDKFQGHIHSMTPGNVVLGHGTGGVYGDYYSASGNTGTPVSDGTNGTPRTGFETAPVNMGMNFIIKI